MMMCSTSTRSSLELMLDSIRQRDEQPIDVPPALPFRPISRARLPPGRKRLPVRLQNSSFIDNSKENEAKNKEGSSANIVIKKIDPLIVKDDTRERPLAKILEIQKSFRGHQVRCYFLQLKSGSIILQSFVRGETARRNYQFLSRRLEAVIVIQRHTKKIVDWRIMQKRQKASIILQSAVRGWLMRKHLSYKEKFKIPGIDHKEDIRKSRCRKPEEVENVEVSPSALADLRRRLHRVETELGNKECENATIRRRLQQFDEKWLESEKKMKSMEKMWQDQLGLLQMSLRAAKNSLATERTRDQLGDFIPIPLHNCSRGDDEPSSIQAQSTSGKRIADLIKSGHENEQKLKENRLDDLNLHTESSKRSFQGKLVKSPDKELQGLKLRYEVWKKDYKVRLHEAKAMLQKLDQSEAKKSRKNWWRR